MSERYNHKFVEWVFDQIKNFWTENGYKTFWEESPYHRTKCIKKNFLYLTGRNVFRLKSLRLLWNRTCTKCNSTCCYLGRELGQKLSQTWKTGPSLLFWLKRRLVMSQLMPSFYLVQKMQAWGHQELSGHLL